MPGDNAQLSETARQGAGILGRDTPAARLENIARFLDFVGESIISAAGQAREVLYTKTEAPSGGTPRFRPRIDNRLDGHTHQAEVEPAVLGVTIA